MHKAVKLQRAMIINSRFGYAMLERHTGFSKPYIRGKINDYEAAGFLSRAGMDGNKKLWRLTQAGRRQFDPHADKAPVLTDVAGERPSIAAHDPEKRLWTAIRELKRFRIEDLLELKLANDTTTRQYVALLRRAGLLIGDRVKDKKSKYGAPMMYTVAEDAGDLAPLMGRCFYLFDPNTQAYVSTPMEAFDTNDTDKIEEKKRPGDVDAS